MPPHLANAPRLLLMLALAALLSGCAAVVGRAGDRFADQLGAAVYDSNDPATVRDGLPAYLLLIDGLVVDDGSGDKGKASLLFAAAELNGAYAGKPLAVYLVGVNCLLPDA